MPTYLLTWNAKKWPWEAIQATIEGIALRGYHEETWSCGRNQRILAGDRIFILRQGKEPRGIVASGWASSAVYLGEHWKTGDGARAPLARYVDVRLDALFDAEHEPIYRREWLTKPELSCVHWDTQVSGIAIAPSAATALETEWALWVYFARAAQL